MELILKYLDTVIDIRQEKKVQHKMGDIIALVFFTSLANADDWVEIEVFGKEHEEFLRRYLELPNGIPSHDGRKLPLAFGCNLSGRRQSHDRKTGSFQSEHHKKIGIEYSKNIRGS